MHSDSYGQGLYAKDNSIHNNFQRCIVVHGTISHMGTTITLYLGSDGLLIKDNVAYNTNGHCYFLEDGNEQSNTFDHNLGVNSRGVGNLIEDPLQIIPTDSSPSVFWITNPNNTFINNTAVFLT